MPKTVSEYIEKIGTTVFGKTAVTRERLSDSLTLIPSPPSDILTSFIIGTPTLQISDF